jgi:hypothetical protein
MNSFGLPLVAARGSAFPVSYRKLGSANGNRTRYSNRIDRRSKAARQHSVN